MIRSPSTEPFFFPGGTTGCLLIHGFFGSPAEMRSLGEYLSAQGHTVLGTRLAGHGGTPEALRGTSWHDWLDSVRTDFRTLRQQCPTVVVIGFSLGGALALLLARYHAFERLALLATPLWLQGDWRLHVLPVARYVVPWFYPLEQVDFADPFVRQRAHAYDPDLNLDDPRVQERLRRAVKIPVGAIDELRKVTQRARSSLPRVRVPALVMHGRGDDTAPPESATEIIERIGSPSKQLVWWEQTKHQMVAPGPEYDAILQRLATFVAQETMIQ